MKAKQAPLIEQLTRVPADARLVIDDADGFGTRFIPVGRMCHEASTALREALDAAHPYEALLDKALLAADEVQTCLNRMREALEAAPQPARLIAAAPELLEALRKMREKYGEYACEVCDTADAAIKKATGETP